MAQYVESEGFGVSEIALSPSDGLWMAATFSCVHSALRVSLGHDFQLISLCGCLEFLYTDFYVNILVCMCLAVTTLMSDRPIQVILKFQ